MIYPFVKQESHDDCGFACTSMLINYYQHLDISISELKFSSDFGDGQISLANIQEMLKKYKIEVDCYEVDENSFANKVSFEKPVIAYCINEQKMFHFVVIYGLKRNKLLIADPGKSGVEWIHLEDFYKTFKNVIAITKKEEKYFNTKKNSIFIFLKDYKLFLGCALFLAIVINLLLVLNKGFIKVYLDLLSQHNVDQIFMIFIVFFSLIMMKSLLKLCFQNIVIKFHLKINQKMQIKFWNNVNKIKPINYQKNNNSQWIKRIEDINILSKFISIDFLNLIFTFAMMLFSLIILVNTNLTLFMFTFLENTVTFLITYLFVKVNKRYYDEFYEQSLLTQQKFLEHIHSHSFRYNRNLNNLFFINLINEIETMNKYSYRLSFLNNNRMVYQNLTIQIFNLFIYYFAFSYILNLQMSLGDLMLCGALKSYLIDFNINVSGYLLDRNKYNLSFNRIESVLFYKDEREQNFFNQKIKSLELRDINFQYNDNLVLKNLNLRIDKNLFISAPSGYGKTTLLKILNKSNDKYSGKLIVNDKFELDVLNDDSWINKVMLIEQNDYIFNGMILDNLINFNKENIVILKNNVELISIIENLQIKLDQNCHNNGENLSKGQRQVIAFIGALLEKKDLIIFDESLSNVDEELKIKLIKLLFEIKKDTLIIYAGHDNCIKKYFNQVIDLRDINHE